MTDQELKDLVASISVIQKETAIQMKKQSVEIDNLIKETAISRKETDKLMKETTIAQKETAREIEKTSIQMQKTDETLKSVGVQLGNIGKNQGDVAEEFFVNSLSSTLKVANIQYDEFYKNMYKKTKKIVGEFDIVLINGKDVAIIETKYKAHSSDLEELIEIKHKKFKELYPQYNNYNHHLGLASFHINEELKNDALKKNVFVLQRKGDLIESFLP